MSRAAKSPPKTGKLARSMVAGSAAVRIGARAIRHRLRTQPSPADDAAHHAEIGSVLFTAMGQLRGTALKLAQILSLDNGLLPEALRAPLAQACHQALPLNRALVSRVFRQAFGEEAERRFGHFEPEAMAAASLGQVHRARLVDGTEVAVKLQYPGIAATIDSDLELVRTLLRTVGPQRLGLPAEALVDKALHEARRQLLEEVDYLREAESQAWFARHNSSGDIVIPAVFAEHTRATVLTQELLPGKHLEAWLATPAPAALRDRQGQAIFDWFTALAFEHRFIHADLHPGNFLFMPDGRVGVLDFGCTRALSPTFTRGLARAWLAWVQQGAGAAEALHRAYRGIGIIGEDLGLAAFSSRVLPAIAPLLDWVTQPLRQPLFDFSAKSPLPVPGRASVPPQAARAMADLPPEMLSMERAWLGLMHLLSRLGATVDTRAALARLRAAAT